MKLLWAPIAALALSACATVSTSQIEGSAETAYQAFVIAEEALVANGKESSATFHTHETAAYNALLAFRLGQITFDQFSATIKGQQQ